MGAKKIMKKLFQFFDKRFFILVTVVFLGTFGAGLVFSSEEIKGSNSGSFQELVTRKSEKEDFDQVDDSDEQKTEVVSQEVLGEKTEKEATTKEALVQEKESLSSDSVDLVEDAKATVSQLTEALKKNDPSSLYNLLGEDLKGTFEKEAFSQAISNSLGVEKVEIFSGPEISGEWMETVLNLTFSDGSKRQYLTVFHWENEKWKLFGTEEIE